MSAQPLRETIRSMVYSELAARILEEAKKKTKGKKYTAKTVYRASKYIDLWNEIPLGTPTTEVTPSPTKHDFVRRFMKELNASPSPAARVYLTPKYRARVLALLQPLTKDPDEFVETLNKERGLIFGQMGEENEGGALRSSPDPVMVMVNQYLIDKDMRKTLEDVVDLPAGPPAPSAVGEEPPAETDATGEYDIIPGTTSKSDIARSLSSDPTETTTDMSVINRLKKAMIHLTRERTLEILEFIRDPAASKADKAALIADLSKINQLAQKGAQRYSELFIQSMIEAMRPVKDIEDDAEIDKAIKLGRTKFVSKLRAAGTFSPAANRDTINPFEFNVFADALDHQEGRWTVLDMIIIAAKKPAQSDVYRDEAVQAVKDVFEGEMQKQTNFNTLGDFTDAMPEMKEIRTNLFNTLEKRGRRKGTTKAVLAQRKAAKKESN